MPILNMTIRRKKISSPQTHLVCGNTDYQIAFNFDSEWSEYDTKTARFYHNGAYTDVVFTGYLCDVPKITNADFLEVGVFAGDLRTTTPGRIECDRSILCRGGSPAAPETDVYAQIMELLNSLVNLSVPPSTVAAAVEEYMAANPLKETDPTVPSWAKSPQKPGYTADEVGAISLEKLNQAAQTILAQAKASGAFDGDPGEKGDPGKDGDTPYIGDNGNWWVGDEDTGVSAGGGGSGGVAVQADWGENDETKLSHVKGRTHWKEVSGVEALLLHENVVFSGHYKGIERLPEEKYDIVVGVTYFVTWNDKEYKCVAKRNGYNEVFIGNEFVVDEVNDTGEPFFITSPNDLQYGLHKNTAVAETITVKIQRKADVIYHELEPGFIPGGVPYAETAKVGQAIVVSEVDADGKPTKWEAADFQSGEGGGNGADKPYYMQVIGTLYDNPKGYDYVAWCPGNLRYDPTRDLFVSLLNCTLSHMSGTNALFVAYIDPKTYVATDPVRCYTDDGATALIASTAFWIEDDGTYKMLYKYTDNNTYLYTSTDGGMNWVQGDKVNGFSGSPWGITKLSNGRLIFGDDETKVGIYYSDDDGINWTRVVPGTAGGGYEAEACILELKPGKLIAIARYSMSGIGYNASGDSEPAIVSYSEDYGTTWTAWKKSNTITNMNASACAGRVHNGMVDIFAASRWYWHGNNSNTDYDNTGKTGAITHYTATVENALADNFTNNGILVYANAVGDTSSQDFHSPCLAANGDEVLLMWFDRIYPYTEEKTSHYFARGAVGGAMNYAPNDNLASVVFPYSSAKVDKLLKQQYTKLMAKINEIVISGGGTPDVGDDPENPTFYVVDGCILNFNYLDSTRYDIENMTLTDSINGEVGTFSTNANGTAAAEEFPEIRDNSLAFAWLALPKNTLSKYITDEQYALTIEIAMFFYPEDGEVDIYNSGYFPFFSNGNGGGSLRIHSQGLTPYYHVSDGTYSNKKEMSDMYPTILDIYSRNVLQHGVVAMAADGTVSLYHNGELVISEVISSTFVKWADVNLTRAFSLYGANKAVRIYNRVLTADEVRNNYNYELQGIK